MMKTRENLQKLVSETKLVEAWAEYKCIRNKVNRLQHKESVWQKSEIGGNKTSKSFAWRMKSVLREAKTSQRILSEFIN